MVIVQCLHKLVTMATPDATPTHHKGCECNGDVGDVFAKLEEVLTKASAHTAITALQSKECHLVRN